MLPLVLYEGEIRLLQASLLTIESVLGRAIEQYVTKLRHYLRIKFVEGLQLLQHRFAFDAVKQRDDLLTGTFDAAAGLGVGGV